jgi:hypothetical protein
MAHHWNPAHFGIRTKTHKLIFYYGCNTRGGNQTPPGWELYDLKKDPHELNNVYEDPDYADAVNDLKARLAEMRKQNGDTDEKFPEVKKVVDEFWDYGPEARKKAEQISHDYAEASRNRGKRSRGGGKTRRGWIEARPSKVPLKKHEGYTEVSRDAAYRVSHPGNAGFNLDNAFLTSGEDGTTKPHAFHTDMDVDQPHIVIRLNRESVVRTLFIRNRKGGFHERAKGLTVWLSRDGKAWAKVWQAKDVAPEWTVDIGKEIPARFVKVGLPGKGTLHLHKVVVFGK